MASSILPGPECWLSGIMPVCPVGTWQDASSLPSRVLASIQAVSGLLRVLTTSFATSLQHMRYVPSKKDQGTAHVSSVSCPPPPPRRLIPPTPAFLSHSPSPVNPPHEFCCMASPYFSHSISLSCPTLPFLYYNRGSVTSNCLLNFNHQSSFSASLLTQPSTVRMV